VAVNVPYCIYVDVMVPHPSVHLSASFNLPSLWVPSDPFKSLFNHRGVLSARGVFPQDHACWKDPKNKGFVPIGSSMSREGVLVHPPPTPSMDDGMGTLTEPCLGVWMKLVYARGL
jgi:hypothetical protein